MQNTEPFHLEGSDAGVLLVHGFTGSTQSIRYLGEQLHRRFGFTVVAPRLPGHGTSPDDMETTGFRDWLGEAERALNHLAERNACVFVAGLSMGGAIALNLAARFPGMVDAVAPIAAPVGLMNDGTAVVLSLDPLPRRVPGIGSDIKAPGVKEVAYTEIPVACMHEVTVLVSVTRDLLHRVVCPALVIHALEDHVVPASNAMEIVRTIRSDDIRLLWLRNSYHVATLDNDKDLIVERVGRFFAEIAGAGAVKRAS
jgi:carboxylesterase